MKKTVFKLESTSNYDLFDLHEFNRDIKSMAKIIASMRRFGFIPAYPLHVVKNGGGRLLIKGGHHRFEAARKLGIPVFYVISDDAALPPEIEPTNRPWRLDDFLTAYVRMGFQAYVDVKNFQDTHRLPLGTTISLLTGGSASNHALGNRFKAGTFTIQNTKNADDVVHLIRLAEKGGFASARDSRFVSALSKICLVPSTDLQRLKISLSRFAGLIVNQGTTTGYLAEIEKIYNRGQQTREPLAFLAEESNRNRWKHGDRAAIRKTGALPLSPDDTKGPQI